MTCILLTGFEPFAGDPGNPSGDAVRALARRWSGPETLISHVLPVSFADASCELRALIDEHAPDLVVATGLAGGRESISLERVAINLRDARIPDNAGAQPIDERCVEAGAAAHFSTLPVKAITAALRAAGLPAEVSHSAGTFVCNDAFYAVMDATSPPTRAGFVHVPWSTATRPADSDAVALADDDLVSALEIILRTALATAADDTASAGALH